MQIVTPATTVAPLYFSTTKGKNALVALPWLFTAMLLGTFAFVQAQVTDTVGLAKQYRSEGKIKQAVDLLQAYHKTHVRDLNSSWLLAQTLYWLHDYKGAEKIYEQTIKAYPANYYLQLDYANVLIAANECARARAILTQYRKYDATSSGFKSAIGALYWQEKHPVLTDPLYKGLNITAKDTLNRAKQLRGDGKINEAVGLLNSYVNMHPADLNGQWLLAQTIYWQKHYKKSEKVYQQAISAPQANYYLQLDYVNVLLADGNLKKAKAVLNNYHKFDSTSTGFKSARAGLYWAEQHRAKSDPLYKGLVITAADTLNHIKQLSKEWKGAASYHLMKTYYKSHDNDFNTTWLYAQVAYLNKHFGQSKALYNKALKGHDDNYYLKLDYAKTLVNIAEYKKAKPLLNTYRSYDPGNIELLLDFAKLYIAQGDYKLAQQQIDNVLKQDGTNTRALALLDELHTATASWLKIKGNYSTDSQPLQTITPAAEAGIYLHPNATLKLNLQTPLFMANGSLKNAQWLQVGDQSTFKKAGFQLGFDAGVVKQPYDSKISWTANIELKQTIAKHLVLQVQAERKPYYYTIGSIDTVVMVNRYSAYAEWNDLGTVNGRIAFELNQFADKNYVISAGGWVFTPVLKVSVIDVRIGYGFGYSTAKSNRFVPEKTVAQILTNYDATAAITGVYTPYFTPNNMEVNSALAAIVIHPVKIFELGFNANVGFYATTLNPYFYLNKDAGNNIYIARDFATEKFTPMEFSAYALFRITKKISLKADYTYRKTYFYTSNSAGIGLKIDFWNEQKTK